MFCFWTLERGEERRGEERRGEEDMRMTKKWISFFLYFF
jgi:hypothetical protein